MFGVDVVAIVILLAVVTPERRLRRLVALGGVVNWPRIEPCGVPWHTDRFDGVEIFCVRLKAAQAMLHRKVGHLVCVEPRRREGSLKSSFVP